MWCHENQQTKCIAEPGSYYVTLDGHGQRDKHDIVILPFFSQNQEDDPREARNRLVYRLGGPTMAFLMDLFTSPHGAPNIRASVAHGSFHGHLLEELDAIEGERDDVSGNANELKDTTAALLSVLSILCDSGQHSTSETEHIIANKGNIELSSYRPYFSYSALLLAELENMVNSMGPFYAFIRDGNHLKYIRNIPQSQKQNEIAHKLAAMSQSFDFIVGMGEKIYRCFGINKSVFTDDSFFPRKFEQCNCIRMRSSKTTFI